MHATHTHMQLGIGNEHHVVVYDNNVDFGFFSAPRVWWMMRVGWFTGGIVRRMPITVYVVLGIWSS